VYDLHLLKKNVLWVVCFCFVELKFVIIGVLRRFSKAQGSYMMMLTCFYRYVVVSETHLPYTPKTIQINHQLDATISPVFYLTFIYSSTVSGVHTPIIRSSTTAVVASGFPSEHRDSCAVGRGRARRPDHDQQYCYHHAPKENQRLLLQLLSSWWWACGRPKHVEL